MRENEQLVCLVEREAREKVVGPSSFLSKLTKIESLQFGVKI